MPAITNYSRNFGDNGAIVSDLLKGIENFGAENTIGFLVCDSRLDYSDLIEKIAQKVDFPVVGGTTMLMPLTENSDEISATFMAFEKAGLKYSISLSDPLVEDKRDEVMQRVYSSATEKLDGEPKLIMPYIPLIHGLATDRFISRLFELSGSVPVFGGVTTDDLDSTTAAVFMDGKAYSDRMVLLMLSGDIRPVFAMGSQLTVMAEYAPVVTESSENIVSRVDDMTFCDYMRSLGVAPEDRINGVDALVQYGPMPARLRYKLQDDDGVPEIRCISYTNVAEGSVAFSSDMPVGTRVNIGIIAKSDVEESARNCIDNLIEKSKAEIANGYEYTALFSVPCIARYFAMVGGENLESKLLKKAIPGDVAVSSYYGFCEIGPTYSKDGHTNNRSNNASIVMCGI